MDGVGPARPAVEAPRPGAHAPRTWKELVVVGLVVASVALAAVVTAYAWHLPSKLDGNKTGGHPLALFGADGARIVAGYLVARQYAQGYTQKHSREQGYHHDLY